MTSFRQRMKANGGDKSLRTQYKKQSQKTGRYPSIFDQLKIPPKISFWYSKEGEHIIDILPFEVGGDMPLDQNMRPIAAKGEYVNSIELSVHIKIGSMGKPFVCPYENFGKPCPICEYIKAHRLPTDQWKLIAPKLRSVYLVWVQDTVEEQKKGVRIFEVSYSFMGEKIREIARSPKTGGIIDYSNIDTGKSIAWTRVGKEKTKYIGHQFVDRDAPIPDYILDQIFPLDQVINMHPSYEEIQKEFRGTLKTMGLEDNTHKNISEGPVQDNSEDNYFQDDIPDDNVNVPNTVQRTRTRTRRRR